MEQLFPRDGFFAKFEIDGFTEVCGENISSVKVGQK
jgi:hypothetical protein